MNNNNIILEKQFLKTNKESGKFICICGRKGSGKSFLATNYIAIAYKYNIYDEYHFILPEYLTDASSKTYNFIKGHPNTTVYNSYNDEITTNIKKQSVSKKILYVLDDATSYIFENKNKANLLNLFTTTRHGKGISVIVICHALKSILTPSIRGMIDYLFIGAFTNYTLIKKHLYEENFSMMMSENEFMEEYKENIIEKPHNFLFIDGNCHFSFNVDEWNLSNFNRNKSMLQGNKVKLINFDKNYSIKSKLYEKKNKKEIENNIFGKKKVNNGGITIKFNNKKAKK